MNTEGKIALIVEKDVGIANMIRAILGIVNVPVTHVQSVQEAEEALKQNNAGIIICEKDTPGGGGYDLLETVRANKTTIQIPFLMLIDESDKSYEKLPAEKRADRYVTKPFTAQKVMDVVKEFIVYKTM